MKHLSTRRDDWAAATDAEYVDALLDRPKFLDPFFYNYVERTRPHCLRRALLLHRDLGGYMGAPALRWLKRGK